MTRFTRFFALLAGLLLSIPVGANPCVNGGLPYPVPDGSGIGGTGHGPAPGLAVSQSDGRGTGGTGHARDSDGAGTGGTGHGDGSGTGGTGHDGSGSGGTGIEGFITGFGSICVNGLEVEYQAAALPDGLDRLAVGQRVQVEADWHGDRLVAQSIRVKHVVAGPVQHIDPATGQFEVMGQRVKLAAAGLNGTPGLGERVKVSGLVSGPGQIVAYKVEPAGRTPDSLTGTVQSVSGNLAKVAGVEVVLRATQRLSAGQEVNLQGSFSHGRLQAATVSAEGIGGFAGRVSHVVLQDVAREVKEGSVRVGADLVQLDRATRMDRGGLHAGQLLRVEASIGARGEVRAERIEIESREAREWNPRPPQADKAGGQRTDGGRGQEAGKQESHEDKADSAGQEEHASGRTGQGGREHDEAGSESPADRERSDRTDSDAAGGRVERSEGVERPERTERPDHENHIERIERPERD